MPSSEWNTTLSPREVTRALAVIATVIVGAGILGQVAKYRFGRDYVMGLVPAFDLNAEGNVSAYFSVLLLVTAGLLLAVVASAERRRRVSPAWPWVVLAVGFLFMGFDEGFRVHERLIGPMRRLLGREELGIFFYAWVIPAIGLVLLLIPVFLRFLLRLPRATAIRFLAAGGLYLGGAIGMELLGGMHAEVHGRENGTFAALAAVEESLEIAGVIVFIRAILHYLADEGFSLRVVGGRVAAGPSSPT